MRRNSLRIGLSVAGLLMAFLATNSYAAKSSRRSGDDGSPITVVIDAGHGGHDRGGIPGQRVAEKDMTLDVALRLRNVLSANGYQRGDDAEQRRICSVGRASGDRQLLSQRHLCMCPFQRDNEAARAASKRISTAAIAYRSRRPFIITSPAVRPQRIAACVAVVISSYEDQHSGGACRVRFSNQPDRSCLRPDRLLSSKTCGRNCSRSAQTQSRWERFRHHPSRDRRKHPATTVHGSNEGHQFQKEPLEAFAQEKRAKKEKLLERVRL